MPRLLHQRTVRHRTLCNHRPPGPKSHMREIKLRGRSQRLKRKGEKKGSQLVDRGKTYSDYSLFIFEWVEIF